MLHEKCKYDEFKSFRKGDKVIMHTCVEAINYKDKEWICESDSFTNPSGFEVVYLIDYVGYFSCKFLNKII